MVQRRQAAPPEHELDQGCVPRARPEPEPDPPAQRPDPAPRLGAAAEHVPVEQRREYGGEEQDQDDVTVVEDLVEQHAAKSGEREHPDDEAGDEAADHDASPSSARSVRIWPR